MGIVKKQVVRVPKPILKYAQIDIRIPMHRLAEEIGSILGVSVDLMRNPEARGLHESNARNIVMAIAVHKHIAWSPTQIASFFGRHTSDVEFAKRRISKAIALRTNTGLQRETERVCKALGIDPSHLIVKK